jgi:hypothetical protein
MKTRGWNNRRDWRIWEKDNHRNLESTNDDEKKLVKSKNKEQQLMPVAPGLK